MNEAQFRDRLHKAVGEAKYPAYLPSRVEAHLQSSAPTKGKHAFGRPGFGRRLPGVGRASSLVAALLVVLLVGALVVGVRAWRDGGLPKTQPVSPSVQDPSIKRYQTLIGTDSQRVISSQSNNCASLADACPTAAANVVAALQQWLDDLDATRPPTRFAYLDAQMRRHIPLAISGLNAAVTAYKAKDQAGMDNAINAAVNERDALEAEVNDIVGARPATNAAYKAVVRSDNANLLACTACQQLLSQNQVSCPASQTPSCPDQIAAARFQLETFQGDVVHDFAPDSLVALDAHLQADLFAASVELSAMDAALSGGDHAALQNGRTLLRQALDRVASDVANIALSN
jgi:hypothetical protein